MPSYRPDLAKEASPLEVLQYSYQSVLEGDYVLAIAFLGFLYLCILGIKYLIYDFILRYHPLWLRQRYRQVLAQHSSYYRRLTPKRKRRFERRVQRFINTHRFVARGKNFALTHEMVGRIAGAAVELTFGFRQFDFEHFKKIIIYPDEYYSNITKKYHSGEVNPRGFLVLSWRAFTAGYARADDGLNLGIHEMAHALKLENKVHNANYRFFSQSTFLEFENYFKLKRQAIEQGSDPVLRAYAASNLHEFFAVSCENFLERPRQLQRHHPRLYAMLTDLLRQDPLQWQSTGSTTSAGPLLQR